jgi:hypothetical protein
VFPLRGEPQIPRTFMGARPSAAVS